MKVLFIDNYDSFTWNLHHLIKMAGMTDIEIVANDRINESMIVEANAIVFSPGPGLPDDAGQTKNMIKKYAGRKKLLGVCLGHQAIAEVFGAEVVHADEIFHGTSTRLEILERDFIFKDMPEQVYVGRYHSWVVSPAGFPADLMVTAIDQKGVIMALRHKTMDVTGVQFHPESVMTPMGVKMIQNWMNF